MKRQLADLSQVGLQPWKLTLRGKHRGNSLVEPDSSFFHPLINKIDTVAKISMDLTFTQDSYYLNALDCRIGRLHGFETQR
ncbi:protein of unknown function [Xenorhabdus poinarii G6]|uniref:Uncharacterized protein n=1 Tax=Xenorhabdus poinarii G6 TaxID=1354304 RepID=A0A068R2J8_9GAMM|nr:protein of unknown function [Xenorhabdus poinarii G6]